MIKYRQNRVAESRLLLSFSVIYGCIIWLAAGLVVHAWWWQFCLFAISSYLIMELNNHHALIRIYSRMMSCSFIFLTCMNSHLFSSSSGAVIQLAAVAFYTFSFRSYQDRQAAGLTFYSWIAIGLASLVEVRILYAIPFCWLLMIVSYYSFSMRTFLASLLGLLAPYWMVSVYFLLHQDFSTPLQHFRPLLENPFQFDYSQLDLSEIITYFVLVALGLIGIIHFLRDSYQDSVRIRMLYKAFIYSDLILMILVPLLPQHTEWLLRVMIVNTSPLIAHFIALTHTRLSNLLFHVIVILVLALTLFHLFQP